MNRSDRIAKIRAQVEALLPQLRQWRHCLHMHPELSLQEFATAKRVRDWLAELPLAFHSPFLETDVVADLGDCSKPYVLLRADMDALPIDEQSTVPYRSQTHGVMHACGHDGHMTMLLGAAHVLASLQESIPQPVRFVFQPGEEMVSAGRDLAPQVTQNALASYAIHGWPGLPTGTVSSCPGPMMAAAAFFEMTFRGASCHAAMPHLGATPVPSMARFISDLAAFDQMMRERDGSVATSTVVRAGQASNVIAESATVAGTIRHLDKQVAARDYADIRSLAEQACEPGVSVQIQLEVPYELPLVNSQQAYARIAQLSHKASLPWERVTVPTMGAEDFAYYLDGREGAMFWLGLGENQPSLHNPGFDFNDQALSHGVLMLCLLALEKHPGET